MWYASAMSTRLSKSSPKISTPRARLLSCSHDADASAGGQRVVSFSGETARRQRHDNDFGALSGNVDRAISKVSADEVSYDPTNAMLTTGLPKIDDSLGR